MFVVVGRFKVPPDGRRGAAQHAPELARQCGGFRGVQFVPLGDHEIATVCQWDQAADWDAAQPVFGPYL